MDRRFWLIQAFNGISYGALLFLVGSGLSLIFGVMRIVNLSHGSYFLLGGYVALSVIWTTGSWLLAIPVAALTIAALGLLTERLFLRSEGLEYLRNAIIGLGLAVLIGLAIGRWHPSMIADWRQFAVVVAVVATGIYFLLSRIAVVAIEADPLRQVLLTVGFAFLFQQAALDIWTGNNFDINPPDALSQSVVVGGSILPLYRVFMIATAAVIGIGAVAGDGKDPHGSSRARHRGRRTDGARRRHRHLAHFHADLLAGCVSGGAGRRDWRRLPRHLSRARFRDPAARLRGRDHWRHGQPGGAAIGALAVGLADNFGKALFPEVSYFTLYAPMALILAIKPTGLFGRE